MTGADTDDVQAAVAGPAPTRDDNGLRTAHGTAIVVTSAHEAMAAASLSCRGAGVVLHAASFVLPSTASAFNRPHIGPGVHAEETGGWPVLQRLRVASRAAFPSVPLCAAGA